MRPKSERVVYLVDDDEAVRDAVAMLLRTAGLVVETFPSAVAFLQAQRPPGPACLVLDVRMPGMSGLTLHAQLAEAGSAMPIVFLTGHGDIPMAVEAVKNGAFDFIEKPFEPHRLLCAVLDALDSTRETAPVAAGPAALELLTAREREVLDHVLAGRITRDIAGELGIAVKTVEFHRARIKAKLGVRSTAELFRVCLQRIGDERSP